MDLHSIDWDYDFRTRAGLHVWGTANASSLREGDRRCVLSFYDCVAKEIWIMPPDWFQQIGVGLFPEDASIFIVTNGEEPAGFSIVRRLEISGGRKVLFEWFTNVRPRYQRLHTVDSITYFLLRRELVNGGSLPFYSLRTRNPVKWYAAARMMTRVAPDLIRGTHDSELYQLARRMSEHVYPGSMLDPETLGVNEAYPGSGYQAASHLDDKVIDRAFYAHPAVASPTGAIIMVGELDEVTVRQKIKGAFPE